jgi:hypothetical protein
MRCWTKRGHPHRRNGTPARWALQAHRAGQSVASQRDGSRSALSLNIRDTRLIGSPYGEDGPCPVPCGGWELRGEKSEILFDFSAPLAPTAGSALRWRTHPQKTNVSRLFWLALTPVCFGTLGGTPCPHVSAHNAAAALSANGVVCVSAGEPASSSTYVSGCLTSWRFAHPSRVDAG